MLSKPLFAVLPEFQSKYLEYIEAGQNYLKDKHIIFAGLARNLSNSLKTNIEQLDKIRATCGKLSYFVYENDSSDNTPEQLELLHKTISGFNYVSEKLDLAAFTKENPSLLKSQNRTSALAKHRNFCIEYIQQNYEDVDYVVVIDLDFQKFSLDGLMNSFGWMQQEHQIKAIAGNSFEIKFIHTLGHQNLWNYDCWAYRGSWWEDLQAQYEYYHYDPMLWFGLWQPPIGSPPIKVNSAFGGSTIYKSSAFLSGKYEGYDCEHVCFHKNLYSLLPDFDLRINPSQIMLF
jgi:hypothetical protein